MDEGKDEEEPEVSDVDEVADSDVDLVKAVAVGFGGEGQSLKRRENG